MHAYRGLEYENVKVLPVQQSVILYNLGRWVEGCDIKKKEVKVGVHVC